MRMKRSGRVPQGVLNLDRYREDLSFDTWFTRILVMPRSTAQGRSRQQRFVVTPADEETSGWWNNARDRCSTERRMLAVSGGSRLSEAVAALPTVTMVFTLSQVDEQHCGDCGGTG